MPSEQKIQAAVSDEEGRAELVAILASDLFQRAPMLSRMLSYIVTKHFEGQGGSLKEYNIGVEALGRRPEFDPDHDSIVRVEASRLRKRLAAYYAVEGAGHRVKLLLPVGSYLPKFVPNGEHQTQPPAPVPVVQPAAPAAPRHWLTLKTGIGAIAVAALVLIGSALGGKVKSRVSSAVAAAAAPAEPSSEEIRISSGYQGPGYLDSAGRKWSSDRFVHFGRALTLPVRRIFGTWDQTLYRTAREGSFNYNIPLKPGPYELRLYFSEIWNDDNNLESDGEAQRRFSVYINDKPVLRDFDIVKDAGGPNIADERVFIDVEPAADGILHLAFATGRNTAALVNGMEIVKGVAGRMLPVRMLCGGGPYLDKDGRLWGSDSHFQGGVVEKSAVRIENGGDAGLYSAQRYGRFTYSIPVADGAYTVALRFIEAGVALNLQTPAAGVRVFDVFCNGAPLLRNFDIFKEAGGERRPLEKVFRRLKPDASGKLVFSFVPVENYPILSAIEIEAEAP
jgi:hypothetical protein